MNRRTDFVRVFATGALLAVLALAAGCGFQLRGSASLPTEMATTWLKPADPTSPFTRELELLLRANGDLGPHDGEVLLDDIPAMAILPEQCRRPSGPAKAPPSCTS